MVAFLSRQSVPLVLALWSALLFLPGLTSGDLWRTEALRAIIAEECLRSGDWLVPTLYGQPLLTKPPGMYAAIALVSWPFGAVTTWSARLPSALAATAVVFLFYWTFARTLGRRAGLLAGLIVPASAFWLDKAPSAEIDMLQVAWVSAAVLLVVRALDDERLAARWWIAALLCVAGGFLTKWTAPLFFYATLIPLLVWRRQLRLLIATPHLAGVACAGLLCGGWVLAVTHLVGWDVFWTAFSREALQHLSPKHHAATVAQLSADHHHKLNYWAGAALFPALVLAMSLPWSALALPAMRPSFGVALDPRGRLLWQALHCWAWPNLLIWTFLPDPSARHAAPLLPAFAGLATLVCIRMLGERGALAPRGAANDPRLELPRGANAPRSPSMRFATTALPVFLVGWLVVKLAFVSVIVPGRTAERQPRVKGAEIAAVVPAGRTLFLSRVKDEGIMFYFGGAVQRLEDWDDLPSTDEPLYAIVSESEWQRWDRRRAADVILDLRDQQRARLFVLRVSNRAPS